MQLIKMPQRWLLQCFIDVDEHEAASNTSNPFIYTCLSASTDRGGNDVDMFPFGATAFSQCCFV